MSCKVVNGACRVSCVRFSPNVMNPVIVSCGWDKVVKVRLLFQIDSYTLALGVMLQYIFATSEGCNPMRL